MASFSDISGQTYVCKKSTKSFPACGACNDSEALGLALLHNNDPTFINALAGARGSGAYARSNIDLVT